MPGKRPPAPSPLVAEATEMSNCVVEPRNLHFEEHLIGRAAQSAAESRGEGGVSLEEGGIAV